MKRSLAYLTCLASLFFVSHLGALEFYVVRHGQTDWNAQDRAQGQSDIPLNDHGRYQADQLGEKFHDVHFDACYSSDLGRTVETAERVLGERDLEIICDSRLREIHFGKFEGGLANDVREEVTRLLFDESENPQDGVERLRDFNARVNEVLREIFHAHNGDECLLISTHGYVIRAMLEHSTFAWEGPHPIKLPNAHYFRLELDAAGHPLVTEIGGWCDPTLLDESCYP